MALRINSWLSWKAENNWVEDKYDWDNELVLVTGASSGFGELIAEKLAKRGTKVITMSRRPLKPELSVYKNIHHYQADLSDWDGLTKVASKIKSEHGDPTVLILNAGVASRTPIMNKEFSDIKKLVDVNLTSHFAMLHHFLPAMIKRNHGYVMSIASVVSYLSMVGLCDYGSTKSGLIALHETLRQELRHVHKADKIRTSIVHTGWTKTPIIEDWEKGLKERGQATMTLEEAVDPIMELLYSGYGTRLIVPSILNFLPGVRGWPHWAQEFLRDKLNPYTGEYAAGSAH
ncbi:hypothetical protein H072_7169 [Dactylellina haptotyla CBS 200.50]|uniref:Uncharacterized protein n=1 Tax=Dactylellina haptotyla (strain CBS 200.50) TaxID=1284197 RepID=S8A7R5_DACHA|nr:hypothetical protein H072_7169 [Dactylellina haptotyla CBS 200.50]